LKRSRIGLLSTVAVVALVAVSTAQAETVPSVQELYRLLKDQQKVVGEQQKLILEQQKRIQELERRATKSEADLVRTRQTVKSTTDAVTTARREVEATRRDVHESKTVMATKDELDRTKAELGTQPSQSVFRVDPQPPGWTAFGEFIYLRPTTDITAFNINQSVGSTFTTNAIALDHSYDPGFRVGLGYRFPGGADLKLAYTFLRAESTTSASKPTTANSSLSSPSLGISSPICCSAGDTSDGTIRYKLSYDVVDAEAGLKFMIGSHLRMRGIAGLRYVRIDQRLTGEIFGTGGGQTAVFFGEAKADYWGIGPRLALAGMWDLGWGFSVNGQFGGTLAVGSQRARSFRVRTGVSPFQGSSEGPSSARLVPGVEAALSLSYKHDFGDNLALILTGGYEFNHWFNLRGFAGGEGGTTSGLSLDGFFARATVKW